MCLVALNDFVVSSESKFHFISFSLNRSGTVLTSIRSSADRFLVNPELLYINQYEHSVAHFGTNWDLIHRLRNSVPMEFMIELMASYICLSTDRLFSTVNQKTNALSQTVGLYVFLVLHIYPRGNRGGQRVNKTG